MNNVDKYVIKHNNGRYVSKEYTVGSFSRAAKFDSKEEAEKFISDDGEDKNWSKFYSIVKLDECKEAFDLSDTIDDFDTQTQADEMKVPNDWEYNEWPDWVDEDEELIDKRSMRCHNRPTENCECPECDEDMSDDEFVEKFGEALKEAKDEEDVAEEENNEDAENVEEADLNSQVADALQAFIPEADEEFDVNTLIDAVLAFFSDEAAIEHIKEVVCPEEEKVETSENAAEEE